MKIEFLEKHAGFIVALLLIALTLVAYWPVFGHDFIGFDDEDYITGNLHVQNGISAESIRWAFTSFYASNWHPLTWITHMVDYGLFGSEPVGHHAVNLLFHAANTFLLCFVLRRMTKSLWKSAFVAALFAVHPMHVESVAWVAERKDVLSTFFWLLTMWTYIRYAERPGVKWYALVVLFLGLGMLSKPTMVTLPFVLLLLDYWPMGRLSFRKRESSGANWRLVREKLPLFAMAAASSAVTYAAQRMGGALATSSDQFRLGVRIGNALLAYVTYIGKMFWPQKLAIFYPHPGTHIPEWQTVGSFVILVCVTLLVLGFGRARRYLAFGWLWYLGTLVPMIGLVQVGQAATADRYTYISYIGLFVVISWGIAEIAQRLKKNGRAGSPPVVAMAIVVIAVLVVGTRFQLRYWQDGLTLFSRAIEVTTDNAKAHHNLGTLLTQEGRPDEALPHYLEALGIKPDYAEAHCNLGIMLAVRGEIGEAEQHFLAAVRIKPDYAEAHASLALASFLMGRYAEAWKEVRLAERYGIPPDPRFLTALSEKMPEP